MLLTLDMFKEPLPAFNIEGEGHIRTYCGGCVSLIIVYVLFLFAMLKLTHLMSRQNPQVNTYVEREAFDESDIWYVEDAQDFMIAFAVTHFITGEVKDDPKYVKWFAEYVIQKDGVYTYDEIPMHVCTEEEFARFHKPNKASSGLVSRYKEAKGFMCMDMRDLQLQGMDPADNTKTVDVMFLPCNMKETLLSDYLKEDRIPEDCNYDRD